MRILHVNKFLYRRGGAEAYMHEVAGLQQERGDEVAFFGMQHPANDALAYAEQFPTLVEFDTGVPRLRDKVAAVGRMFYSSSARRGMDHVLDEFQPDIVHLHNIYHGLSPSILRPVAARGMPAVMTLHDYKLACPTYRFHDGQSICESCMGRRFHMAAVRRCKDGSLLQSAAGGLELGLHTLFGAYDPVRLFLCPSHFLKDKMAEAEVFPDRLRVLNNFVDTDSVATKQTPGGPFVYAGRLSFEKAVDTLVRAVGLIPTATLEIAGEGDRREDLERLAAEVAPGRVRFHGRLPKSGVHELLQRATAMVLPSRWYENQPMSILEAYACGVPVIASRLGGHLELVDEPHTGYLAEPDDPASFAAAMRSLLADPDRGLEMGRAGRRRVVSGFSTDSHLARLGDLYVEAGVGAGV
jgi:glycosyltransferase involved in cell wall biosynthesis